MVVGTEFLPTGSSPHRCHHAVSDDQGSDVPSMRLGDVRLDQHGFADGEKTLHEIARLVERMSQEDALTLGTGVHFDDHREAPHSIDGLIDIEDITNIHRRWDVDSIPCEDTGSHATCPAPEDPSLLFVAYTPRSSRARSTAVP